MEDQRRPWVLEQLLPFARHSIREKEEPALVDPPQQRHAGGRAPGRGRCRQRHRFREWRALGFSEPVAERRDRIWVEVLEVHLPQRMHARRTPRRVGSDYGDD